jgi:molybdopterin molybdotransferase
MIEVAEALRLVLQQVRPLSAQAGPPALGRVLAEDVTSDIDVPPFDKAMMDGYAVRSADLASGSKDLEFVEEITAGRTPTRPLAVNQAARIMTGAPMPDGADAVAMVEHCLMVDDTTVRVPGPIVAGQNVQPRARELRRDDRVLRAGVMLRPQEIGLLAIVGRTSVISHPHPRVAVLATGDELVEPNHVPGEGQIRNSNGPMLVAQAASAGAVPHYLGIGRDNISHLWQLIGEGLTHDVLLLSGGVSAGKLDLAPEVFRELGVQVHFHKVRMKPGKPLFFGSRGGTLVFGLPGNPASSFVGFELFVRPALRRLRGLPAEHADVVSLPLAVDFAYSTDRPTYHPARIESNEGGEQVWPVPWLGSPDLRALTAANALMVVPEGDHRHRAGGRLPVLRL